MNLFNLMAKLGIDTSEFEKGVDNSEKGFGGFGKKVVGVIAGLGIAKLGKDMISMGVSTNTSLEQSGVAWTTLLGTQEKSKKMLDDITEFAAKTPFSKMGVDNMAKQLNNAGFQGQDLFNQLTKFGDMGSAFGIQEASLEEMVRQYGQVQQAGVAYTEDLNILQDRGIPIYKALAEATGTNVAEVKKMASEGKISADIYNKAIDGIASNTTGAMEAQSLTFGGLWSTIKDGAENIIGKITIPIFKALKGVMEKVGPVIDNIGIGLDAMFERWEKYGGSFGEGLYELFVPILGEDIANKIGDIADAFESFFKFIVDNKDVVIAGLAGIGAGFLVFEVGSKIQAVVGFFKDLKLATEGLTIAQIALNFAQALSPMTWIAIGVGVLVAAFVLLWTKSEGFREFWIGLWEVIKVTFSTVWEAIMGFFTETIPAWIDSIKEFFASLPEWFGTLWEGVKGAFVTGWNAIVTFFTETIPSWLEQMFNWFMELPGKIAYALGFALGSIVKWGVDTFNYLVENVPKWIASIVKWFSELPDKIWKWLVNTVTKIVNWGTDMLASATIAMGNFINEVVKWISELPDKIWKWLVNTVAKVVDWGGNLAKAGGKAIGEMVDSIIKIASELPGKMLDIGVRVVEGIWEGIKSMTGWIGNKVTGFFKGMLKGAKEANEIQSPSKLYKREVGRYIAQGIGVGFEDELPDTVGNIKKQLNSMVAKVTPKINGGIGTESFQGANTVINQTINTKAVLSPLEIGQQTKNTFDRARWKLA